MGKGQIQKIARNVGIGREGRLGLGARKILIGGSAASLAGAARLTVSWGATGIQAPNTTHKGKSKRRITSAPHCAKPACRAGWGEGGVLQNSQSSFASVLRVFGRFTPSHDADMGAMRRH